MKNPGWNLYVLRVPNPAPCVGNKVRVSRTERAKSSLYQFIKITDVPCLLPKDEKKEAPQDFFGPIFFARKKGAEIGSDFTFQTEDQCTTLDRSLSEFQDYLLRNIPTESSYKSTQLLGYL